MLRFFSLASGSSGNCIFVGSDNCNLLVDAGISSKRIVAGLAEHFIQPESVSAILITHEHSDHVNGLPVFLKKYPTSVYATEGTIRAIKKSPAGAKIPPELFHPIDLTERLTFGDIEVECCGTSHDAACPVAFSFLCEGCKVGMATDLGCITPGIVKHLSDARILYLESNYDRYMLLAGSYPYSLKQRIMGDRGHLSNEDSARLLLHVMNEKLRYIMLAHLSKENNMPDLALLTIKNELDGAWNYDCPRPRLMVAPRDVPSELIELT